MLQVSVLPPVSGFGESADCAEHSSQPEHNFCLHLCFFFALPHQFAHPATTNQCSSWPCWAANGRINVTSGDIIRDGVTGTLTKVGDVAAFSNAIRQLMDDPEKLAKMGLQAQSIVRQDHSMEGASLQLDAALTGLISG